MSASTPSIEPERIQVAVGIVQDPEGRLLVGQRMVADAYQGQWEFPGGKLNPGEDAAGALDRELQEELGMTVLASEPLISLAHDYPDRRVQLHARTVTRYRGRPTGREGQALRWVAPQELWHLDMLAANRPLINAARLPQRYFITDIARLGLDTTAAVIRREAAQGPLLVQLREKALSADRLQSLAAVLQAVCEPLGVALLVNGDTALAQAMPALGVHLPAAQLRALQARPLPVPRWVGASCHDTRELARAADLGVDFAVLSPVAATASHPAAAPLGWTRFDELCASARLPVYALGGLRAEDLAVARAHGAQGVAMIGGAWS